MAFVFKALRRNGSMQENSNPLLVQTAQKNCRDSRPQLLQSRRCRTRTVLSYISRFFFWSSGYNKRFTKPSQLYCIYLFVVCWYQVVYEIFKISGCQEFGCQKNRELEATRKFEFATYLLASIGSALSYMLMLLCLNILYKRDSNGITPYSGLKDMSDSKAKIVLPMVLVSSAVFSSYFFLFLYIAITQHGIRGYRLVVYTISVLCEFIAQWVGMVSLYAFSCSTFAIGKSVFASLL